jgi:hypothetical protein
MKLIKKTSIHYYVITDNSTKFKIFAYLDNRKDKFLAYLRIKNANLISKAKAE